MISKQKKKETIEKFGARATNTGTASVQSALLTERINELVKHFEKNPKDFGSKRGFLKLVGQRKRLLNYLKKSDRKEYKELTKKLGLA